jgi:hypothetical protein
MTDLRSADPAQLTERALKRTDWSARALDAAAADLELAGDAGASVVASEAQRVRHLLVAISVPDESLQPAGGADDY